MHYVCIMYVCLFISLFFFVCLNICILFSLELGPITFLLLFLLKFCVSPAFNILVNYILVVISSLKALSLYIRIKYL